MTNSKEISRFASSQTTHKTIALSQIVTDVASFCHRESAKLDPSKVENLATSLAQEGLQTPLVVIEHQESGHYKLISGHRRYEAFKFGIENNHPEFSSDMQVEVIVLSKGANQSDSEFGLDVLIRSVSDNSDRVKFDEFEKVKIVKIFQDRGVQVSRGSVALEMSDSQYRRNLIIVKCAWMYAAVIASQVKFTNAAKLLETVEKIQNDKERVNPGVDREILLEEIFNDWVVEAERELSVSDDARSAKNQKKNEGSQRFLTRFFNPKRLNSWIESLTNGCKPVPGELESFKFVIHTSAKDRTLNIPKVELKGDEMTLDNLKSIVSGINEAKAGIGKLLVKVKADSVIDEDEALAAFEGTAKQASKDLAGNPVEQDQVKKPELVDVENSIEQQLDSEGVDSSAEGEG